MRTINLIVLAILVFGIASSGVCLFSIETQNPSLDSLICPLLGPGIVVAVVGALMATMMLAIGVTLQMIDSSERLFPSLYVLNAVIALAVPISLMV